MPQLGGIMKLITILGVSYHDTLHFWLRSQKRLSRHITSCVCVSKMYGAHTHSVSSYTCSEKAA